MAKPEPVDHPLVDHPLHERLGRILERATGKPLVPGRHAPMVRTGADDVIGANAYLRVLRDSPEGGLAVYPADTLTQAKAFYRCHNALAGVRELRALPGWHARPNFHFGHFQRGYCWTCNKRDLDEFVQLWCAKSSAGRPYAARTGTATGAGSRRSGSPARRTGPNSIDTS
jgi:hypothetical protein